MRRLAVPTLPLFLTGVLVLVLAPTAPAHADEVVVIHVDDFPHLSDDTPVGGVAGRDCEQPTQWSAETAQLRIDYTDDETEPAGARAHGFDLAGGSAFGPYAHTWTPSTSVLTARVKVEGGQAQGMLFVFYLVFHPFTQQFDEYVGYSPITLTGSGWTTIDGDGATYQWWRRDHSNVDQPWASWGTSTLPEFVQDHGGDGDEASGRPGAWLGVLLGCDGNPFRYDALRVGPPGDVTTYDFEGLPSKTLIESSRSSVVAGREVLLRGAPDPDVSRWADIELTLEARPHGAAEFAPVGSATSTDEGGELTWASSSQRPSKRTEYRWVLPDTAVGEGSTSAVQVVEVRTAVTASLVDRTLTKGDRLVVTGDTFPRKRGVGVTLQRLTDGRWRDLANGRTTRSGQFELSHRVDSPGTWKVRVQVARDGGNLAGTSPPREASVGRR